MASVDNKIVRMVITLILIGFLLPWGLVSLLNINNVVVNVPGLGDSTLANTTGGTTATGLIIGLVPLAIGIGLVLYFINSFVSYRKGM